jgi:hypothetical protein
MLGESQIGMPNATPIMKMTIRLSDFIELAAHPATRV